MLDPTNPIHRARLLTGDVYLDDPIFEDGVYSHYLTTEGLSEIDTAITITRHILALITLSPERERAGSFEVYKQNVGDIRKRLEDLEKQKSIKSSLAPMVINPGKSNSYKYLDSLFNEDWR